MKHTILSALLFALVSTTSTLFGAAMPGPEQGQAIVKKIIGNATYTDDTGASGPLKADQALKAGTTVKTGADSSVVLDLGDNGQALSINPDSSLDINTLTRQKNGSELITNTRLEITKGAVIGNVKKLSKSSTYEVHTPNGVAGIRGTSYTIGLTPSADGKTFTAMISCGNGVVNFVSGTISGTGSAKTFTITAGNKLTTAPAPAPLRLDDAKANSVKQAVNNLLMGVITQNQNNVAQSIDTMKAELNAASPEMRTALLKSYIAAAGLYPDKFVGLLAAAAPNLAAEIAGAVVSSSPFGAYISSAALTAIVKAAPQQAAVIAATAYAQAPSGINAYFYNAIRAAAPADQSAAMSSAIANVRAAQSTSNTVSVQAMSSAELSTLTAQINIATAVITVNNGGSTAPTVITVEKTEVKNDNAGVKGASGTVNFAAP